MRSFKKNKSDLGNGSHSVTGAIPDVTTRVIPDEVPKTNPDGTTPANVDDAEQLEESNDSSGTII